MRRFLVTGNVGFNDPNTKFIVPVRRLALALLWAAQIGDMCQAEGLERTLVGFTRTAEMPGPIKTIAHGTTVTPDIEAEAAEIANSVKGYEAIHESLATTRDASGQDKPA